MNQTIVFDLDHNRKRLEYYEAQKALKGRGPQAKTFDKWIAIYSERVTKLERQVSRLGLKTQLDTASTKTAARA